MKVRINFVNTKNHINSYVIFYPLQYLFVYLYLQGTEGAAIYLRSMKKIL